MRLTPELIRAREDEAREFRFLRGHFSFSSCEMLRLGHTTLTMLRSPKERLFSWYSHMLRSAKNEHPSDTPETSLHLRLKPRMEYRF